jgi:hypothetical protein
MHLIYKYVVIFPNKKFPYPSLGCDICPLRIKVTYLRLVFKVYILGLTHVILGLKFEVYSLRFSS